MVKLEYGSGGALLLGPALKTARPEPKPLRGAIRLLESMGHGTLTEFPLKSGRRADILSLGEKGEIWIVEVKSGVPDFRSDRKWQDYLEWCDRFFFAVGPEFPAEILPSEAACSSRTNTKPSWSGRPPWCRSLARGARHSPCVSRIWLPAGRQEGTIPSRGKGRSCRSRKPLHAPNFTLVFAPSRSQYRAAKGEFPA